MRSLQTVRAGLARTRGDLQSEVYMGKIDGEKERALANRLSANKGFPTIILLHQNKTQLLFRRAKRGEVDTFAEKVGRGETREPWHKTNN